MPFFFDYHLHPYPLLFTYCTSYNVYIASWWHLASIEDPAYIRDPASIGDPASIRTTALDPRLVLETWLLFETRLLLEVLRYVTDDCLTSQKVQSAKTKIK